MPHVFEPVSASQKSINAAYPSRLDTRPHPDLENAQSPAISRFGNLIQAGWLIVCILTTVLAMWVLTRHVRQVPPGQLVHEVLCLHIPMAVNTFVAGGVAFIAGIMFLMDRNARWDDLGLASAKVAVVLCTGVLLTGMAWSRCARNEWWSWTPHQTFSLVLWLLYVGYLLLRISLPMASRPSVCAAYGVIAFLDVPLVYLSANLMPESPSVALSMAGPLKMALAIWFVPVTMITVALIVARYRLSQRRRMT